MKASYSFKVRFDFFPNTTDRYFHLKNWKLTILLDNYYYTTRLGTRYIIINSTMFSIYLPSHRENAHRHTHTHTHTHCLLQIDKINGKFKWYVYKKIVIQSGVFSMEFGEDKERTGMFRMESVSKKK